MKLRIGLDLVEFAASYSTGLLFCLQLAAIACLLLPVLAGSHELPSTYDKWVEVPSGIHTSGDEGNVAKLRSGSNWRKVTEDQVRLINGSMIVKVRTKAIFISQKFGSDQLMTRIAPGAIALITGPEKVTVSNLSKRCCGAVIVYLPNNNKIPANANTNKISVLSGETVHLELVENKKPAELLSSTEHTCTACGTVRVIRRKEDLDCAIERLNLREILDH